MTRVVGDVLFICYTMSVFFRFRCVDFIDMVKRLVMIFYLVAASLAKCSMAQPTLKFLLG